MRPVNYRIHLEPDMDKFIFHGMVQVTVKLDEPCGKIVLNVKDLEIESCGAVTESGEELKCTYTIDKILEEAAFSLPISVSGYLTLIISYRGVINDLMVGFYRSAYQVGGRTGYIAVTQFEEKEARRAFPCFDHPSMKATFDVELVVKRELTAISNTEIVEEKTLDGERKLVRFATTPPMSTYLLFFGVGEFEFMEGGSVKPKIRVATTPEKSVYGEYALRMGGNSISYMEKYTGIRYPMSKCDYIAVPDFVFGAMENYGAITFRENMLLVYPKLTSKTSLMRVASIIAHETAHMWFGNLVSPADWPYIWLNESFATYFSYTIVDNYYPQWVMWDRFIIENVVEALDRDSLICTIPIQLPADMAVNINNSTAPIIYNKGASVLRMLKTYLGEEKFRRAVNLFLKKYSFSVASSEDYWEAFEEASKQPVKEYAYSWIRQAGYPFIEAKLEAGKIVLRQERFTFLPDKSGQKWLIPVEILMFLRGGKEKRVKTVMEGETVEVKAPSDLEAFKVNAGQTGFYRVKYQEENLQRLGALAKDGRLSSADSFGLENDFYAFVRRKDYSVSEYISFLEKYYLSEARYLPLTDIIGNLMELYLVAEAHRPLIKEYGLKLCEQVLGEIGFEPRDREDLQTSELRGNLLWAAYSFGSIKVKRFGESKFRELLRGRQVHQDILPAILKIGASVSEEAEDYLKSRVIDPDAPEIEKIYALNALGKVKGKENVLRILDFTLQKVPKKNVYILVNSASRNLDAAGYIWDWFTVNLRRLERLPPTHLGRVIASIVPVEGLSREEIIRGYLEDYVRRGGMEQDTVEMALEQLKVFARLRAR